GRTPGVCCSVSWAAAGDATSAIRRTKDEGRRTKELKSSVSRRIYWGRAAILTRGSDGLKMAWPGCPCSLGRHPGRCQPDDRQVGSDGAARGAARLSGYPAQRTLSARA